MTTTLNAPVGEAAAPGTPVLQISDLRTTFHTPRGPVRAVDGVSLELHAGQTLGLVGESGSGKSVLGRTLMGLVSNGPTTEVAGTVRVNGQDVHELTAAQRRELWGPQVAMVFQDPMTSLNPTRRIGAMLAEPLRMHLGMNRAEAKERSIELLTLVGIPEPARRIRQFPHELSGGMRQRVMIALALSCNPRLLIADEPTTALDVTVQKQILDLLARLATELQMATILVSHDLGVVRGRTDRVAVMYGGRVVESGTTSELFAAPSHPYTEGLIGSTPALDAAPHTRLRTIEGHPPDMALALPGCRFAPRCGRAVEQCSVEFPPLLTIGSPDVELPHRVACYRPLTGDPAGTPTDTPDGDTARGEA